MHTRLMASVFLAAAVWWLGVAPPPVRGERLPAGPLFDQAYETLVKADEASENRNWNEAAGRYREALEIYVQLSTRYPDWQPNIVKFRISYCNNQLDNAMKYGGLLAGPGQTNAPMGVDDTGLIGGAGSEDDTGLGASKAPQDVSAIKAMAAALLKEGDNADARTALMDALRADPDDPGVRLLIGMAQCQAHAFRDALQILHSLAAEEPDNAFVHLTLGTAHFGLGQMAEAAGEVGKALELSPNLGEAHFDMAQILLSTTPLDMDAVRRHYQRALELGCPADPALNILME